MSAEGRLFNSASTVEYNGVTIDNIVSSKVTIEPTYNERGTDIKYVTYTIEMEAIVHPEAFVAISTGREFTDDALMLIRRRLMEPRKVLKYTDKGLGTDVVIDPSDNTHVLHCLLYTSDAADVCSV